MLPKTVEHIASEIALEIVTRCVAYARARGWEIAAAVCDAGAHRLRWRAKMARHRKPGLDRGFELNRL